MARIWTVALALAGCGRWNFDESRTGTDAPFDAELDAIAAAPACSSTAPFGVPVPIPVLSDVTVGDGTMRLAEDELTGYFWSRRGGGVLARIYYAARPDLQTPFTIQPVSGLNTTGNDLDPTLPSLGSKVLVFRHNMPGDDLWMATAVTATEFTGAAPIASLNSPQADAQPFYRPGADDLIYQSTRTGAGDLYRTVRTTSTTFNPPARIVELATAYEEGDPVLSMDGLTLYFRSNAPAGPLRGHNIYVATRAAASLPWGAPALVPNVNSALEDGPRALSTDGCRLYISSDRNGTNDVFVATRGP